MVIFRLLDNLSGLYMRYIRKIYLNGKLSRSCYEKFREFLQVQLSL